MTGGEDDKANQQWQNQAAMEVKKPVGSRRRQLVLKMMTPISRGGNVASRKDESIDWRHNRPDVQAETPVGGGRGGRW
uniref:Plasmodium vivax circumsporozoite protein-like protein n=1 Tax=Oryza sativa subsp. japonica TaxID=39947 RepID=Q69K12_ORYSJ|nr:plasmodium vivax circumsporozoite protein-like protein [Oryza sativa Japonica Group]